MKWMKKLMEGEILQLPEETFQGYFFSTWNCKQNTTFSRHFYLTHNYTPLKPAPPLTSLSPSPADMAVLPSPAPHTPPPRLPMTQSSPSLPLSLFPQHQFYHRDRHNHHQLLGCRYPLQHCNTPSECKRGATDTAACPLRLMQSSCKWAQPLGVNYPLFTTAAGGNLRLAP